MKRSVAERLAPGTSARVLPRLVPDTESLPAGLHAAAGTVLGIAVSALLWMLLLGAAFWIAG